MKIGKRLTMKHKAIGLLLILALIFLPSMVFAQEGGAEDTITDNAENAVSTGMDLSGSPGVTAQESVGQEFEYYENEDGTLTINKYNGSSAEIEYRLKLMEKKK